MTMMILPTFPKTGFHQATSVFSVLSCFSQVIFTSMDYLNHVGDYQQKAMAMGPRDPRHLHHNSYPSHVVTLSGDHNPKPLSQWYDRYLAGSSQVELHRG